MTLSVIGFLRKLQTRPDRMPLFFAWCCVTVLFDTLVMLLLSDLPFKVVLNDCWERNMVLLSWTKWTIYLLIVAKIALQGWLAVLTPARTAVWLFVSCALLWIVYFNFRPHNFTMGSQRSGVLVVIALFQTLVLCRIRTRFWLWAIVGCAWPFINAGWDAFLVSEVEDFFNDFITQFGDRLYVDRGFSFAAWTIHGILSGAVLAWLMPPVKLDEKFAAVQIVKT
jgi:hypothetical protein